MDLPISNPITAAPPRISRSIRRSLILATALVALPVLAAGCSSTKSVLDAPSADAAEVSVLFSVLAPSMDVAASGDAFTLSVPADSSTAWFTDRPDRTAGSMTLADLVSMWSAQGFDTDPPNAAVAVTVAGEQHQHVVELTTPVVVGDTVTFRAVDLGKDETTDPVAGRDATHDVTTGHFGATELFIDNATQPPCASSITSAPSGQCLAAAKSTVTLTITTTRQNQCVITTRSTGAVEYVTIGEGNGARLPLDNDQPAGFKYASGQTWKVYGEPAALIIGFGTCPGGA